MENMEVRGLGLVFVGAFPVVVAGGLVAVNDVFVGARLLNNPPPPVPPVVATPKRSGGAPVVS